jgi:hypothetical protein
MTTLAGSQIASAVNVLSPTTDSSTTDILKLVFQFVISAILIGVGIYFLAKSGTSSELEKIATGWIGAVVGYWLK